MSKLKAKQILVEKIKAEGSESIKVKLPINFLLLLVVESLSNYIFR